MKLFFINDSESVILEPNSGPDSRLLTALASVMLDGVQVAISINDGSEEVIVFDIPEAGEMVNKRLPAAKPSQSKPAAWKPAAPPSPWGFLYFWK